MRLTLLGTGTPSPSLDRQSSGYAIELPGRTIVLDHGGGSHQNLLKAGISPQAVTHLLISHLHSDHILDVPRLVMNRWDQSAGNLPPLKVLGPKPVARTFELLFSDDGVFGPDIKARREHPASLAIYQARGGIGVRPKPQFDLREVEPGDRHSEDGLEISVGRSQHFEPLLNCLCYRMQHGAAGVVYAADTGYNEEVAAFASGCDVLVMMCQYLEGTALPAKARHTAASHIEVARMAKLAGAKVLVLTHLSRQFDDPFVRSTAHRDIAAIFPGSVIWGHDGMVLDLGENRELGRFD